MIPGIFGIGLLEALDIKLSKNPLLNLGRMYKFYNILVRLKFRLSDRSITEKS